MKRSKFLGNQRQRRRYRVRKKVQGTAERPRMSVQRTSKHLACQLVDDVAGRTVVAVTTRDKEMRDSIPYGGNCDAAKAVGQAVARKALAAGVKQVRFDRGHCRYHGRVAALADAAREGGLEF